MRIRNRVLQKGLFSDRDESLAESSRELCAWFCPSLFVLAGLVIQSFLRAPIGEKYYLLLYPALAFGAFLGGFWPMLVATTLATFGLWYFFVPEVNSFQFRNSSDTFGVAIFGMTGVLFSVVSGKMHRAQVEERRALREAAHALRSQKDALEKFQKVFDEAPIGMAILDRDCKIQHANGAFCAMLGYSNNELAQMSSAVFSHPDDMSKCQKLFSKVLSGEKASVQIEKRYVSKDGKTLVGNLHVSTISASEGAQLCLLKMVQDITQRREAEESLDVWAHVVGNAKWGIVVANADGSSLKTMNPYFAEMHGYTHEELLEGSIKDICSPECQAAMLNCSEREQFTYESTHVRKDGTVFPVLIDASAIRDENGKVLYRAVNVRDMSRDEQSREAIRESERRLHLILEALPVGVRLVTNERTTVAINRAAREIWGDLPNGEPIDFPPSIEAWWLDSGVKLRAEDWTAYRAIVTGTEQANDHIVIKTSGGLEKIIANSSVPVREDSGRVIGAIVVTIDITERVRLQKVVAQTQKMESLGALAANIAHDFRTVLGLIIGSASLISRQADPNDFTVHRHADAIRETANQGLALVGRILDFTKASDMHWEPVDIQGLVEECLSELKPLRPASIRVESSFESDVSAVVCDRKQMKQVILNLYNNAIEAMPDGGVMTIQTRSISGSTLKSRGHLADETRYLWFSLSDTGIGMDSNTQIKLFEPFFTTKSQSGGTGLGLPVVYGTIARHGGFLEVESSPGHGAHFHIYLPYIPPERILRSLSKDLQARVE